MHEVYGVELLRWAAARAQDPPWTVMWGAVAFLGAPTFFAIALPLLFALAPARLALRMALAFAIAAATSEWIKHLVGRPRPDVTAFGLPGPLEDPGAYASAAFPSGHALMAVVLWGVLAVHARSTALRSACVLLMLAICASRIALVRHDLLDVGGGVLFGAVIMFVFVRAEGAWAASLAALPRIERAGLWVLAAIALQVLAGLEATAVILGVSAGLGTGATLAAARKRRLMRPGVGLALLRAVLALAGAAVARSLAEPGDGWPPVALFTLYFTAGIWVGALVPLIAGGVWERPSTSAEH